MPICRNCKNKWTWQQTVKQLMRLNVRLSCPYCEANQYQTKHSKMKGGILTGVIVFGVGFLPGLFDLSISTRLGLLPILIVLIILIYPYTVSLSSKEA